MATITFLLFGLIALSSLKVNLLPDLSYPTLTVRTEYTGAAPAEIETLITEPAEEALGVVKGLRKLKSISRTGQSDVVLEFAWGTDMDQASLEVRDKMESLQFPLEAEAPVLLRFNPSTQPIMRLVLSPKSSASEDEAIRIANETPYGLAGYVWSGNVERARRVARQIRAGNVNINGTPNERRGPFGGYKHSGNGREYGRFGIEDYLEIKAVAGWGA